MEIINIYDAINVSLSNRCEYPFNLKFGGTIKDERANGPGVYLISFKDSPIYFGKYQPFNRSNIFNDRWLRHIETITLRGERVGFGPNSRVDKILLPLCDDLKIVISKISEDELYKRLRDTGVCSSYNRRAFASQNWKQLSTALPSNVLDDFEFRYYKIGNIQDAEEAKKVTSFIEGKVIKEFALPINHTKGRIKPESIDCIESRVLGLIEEQDLQLELILNLKK